MKHVKRNPTSNLPPLLLQDFQIRISGLIKFLGLTFDQKLDEIIFLHNVWEQRYWPPKTLYVTYFCGALTVTHCDVQCPVTWNWRSTFNSSFWMHFLKLLLIRLHEEHFSVETFFSAELHSSGTASGRGEGAKWCHKKFSTRFRREEV